MMAAAGFGRLDRYIAKAVIAGSLASLFVFVSLIFIFSFIEESAEISGTYTAVDALFHVAMQVPQRAYESFPVATLIGSLMTLGGLAARSELVVMRAAGLSVLGVSRSVMLAGLLLAALAAAIGEWVAPTAEQWAKQSKTRTDTGVVGPLSEDGFWARDGERFIHVGHAPSASFLNDVTVYLFAEDQRLDRLIQAKTAHHAPGGWQLGGVQSTVFDDQRVLVRQEEDVFWPSGLDPNVLSVVVVEPEALSIAALWTYVSYLDRNALDSSRYRLAFWIKVATPLATLTMLLLTVPLVFGSLRSVGAGQRIFIGVMIGITFFLSNNLLNHLGLVYGLAPLPSALLPTALFFLISVYFAARVR